MVSSTGDGRCEWALSDPLNIHYHDNEWGRPEFDEARLFEMLTLEGAQAGLSWITILKKREGYRKLFAGFDPGRVAGFDANMVDTLLLDASIVRHRGKIEATVNNARRIISLWDEGTSLQEVVWSFVDGKPVQNGWKRLSDLPSSTSLSKAMSTELKRRGFRFVGPTTCYAFMQAAGLVNDHITSCPSYSDCSSLAASSTFSCKDSAS
jgi:DNA-3-methyladenine glycosylase I